jgi:hypothetical protein
MSTLEEVGVVQETGIRLPVDSRSAGLLNAAGAICGVLCVMWLSGCVTIQQPASNSSVGVNVPVAATVVWNEDMQAGTFSATLDGADVTTLFSVDSSGRRATAILAVPACPATHNLVAGGSVWSPLTFGYGFTNDTSTFASGNGPYKSTGYSWCGHSAPTSIDCGCPAPKTCHAVAEANGVMTVDWYCQP